MRLALAQINTSMGAIEANCRKIDRFLNEAKEKRADLVIFPELAVVGYPPKDLLDQDHFVEKSHKALAKLAVDHVNEKFLVGFVGQSKSPGKGRCNSAAYVENGQVKYVQHKMLLPTYDVFDETRYFDAGQSAEPVLIGDTRFGITICEDIWNDETILGKKLYEKNPAQVLKNKGAEVILNLSASPYHGGKEKIREQLLGNLSKNLHLPVVLVNLVGGNDELIFDGGSFAMDRSGKMIGRAKVFQEDLLILDLHSMEGEIRDWPAQSEAWLAQALTLGIHDYVNKCGFKKVLIGLSGGIDSSLVALLATEALGADRVTGISMPSKYTSQASREDAETMAKNLGIQFVTVPIERLVHTYEESLSSHFSKKGRDTTEENLQARIRGNILMAFSNKFGSLVLSTGNKSELAVGYCTQYGDMVGGLSAISDVPKQEVYRIARFLNQKQAAIPERVFTRPPTAELKPNQKDEDSLPPYEVLDSILEMYIEEAADPSRIKKSGIDPEIVDRVIEMVDQNEFKRRQAAPGLRLSAKAFGIGRRMPIAREGL